MLDTDTLSALMRGEPLVLRHARAYLADHGKLTISIITRYEILRGLMAKRAAAKLTAFENLCQSLEILSLDDATIVRAAAIYASLRNSGRTIGDAGILIAATALQGGWEIVTNNESHFMRIANLSVGNWLKP